MASSQTAPKGRPTPKRGEASQGDRQQASRRRRLEWTVVILAALIGIVAVIAIGGSGDSTGGTYAPHQRAPVVGHGG